MLRYLEGIRQTDTIVRKILLTIHQFMEYTFNVDIRYIVCQQYDFIAENLLSVFALQVLRLDESTLKQTSNKRTCAHEWIEDIHVFIRQGTTKVGLQDVVHRTNDKVHTLHWRIDNTQLRHGFRESTFEELFVERLDNTLLTFQVINVTHILSYILIEVSKSLCVSIQLFFFQKVEHFLHRAAYRIVLHKTVPLKQSIKNRASNHVLSYHLDSLFLIHTRIDILLQTLQECIKLLGCLTALYQLVDTIDEFLRNIANLLRPVLPIKAVAYLLNQLGIDTIL